MSAQELALPGENDEARDEKEGGQGGGGEGRGGMSTSDVLPRRSVRVHVSNWTFMLSSTFVSLPRYLHITHRWWPQVR